MNLITIDREYLEGALYVKNYKEYLEGYRLRTNFIRLNDPNITPLGMINLLVSNIIGYNKCNHIALHRVWFDVQGLSPYNILDQIKCWTTDNGHYDYWEPVKDWFIIYNSTDETKGLNKERKADLFAKYQYHHVDGLSNSNKVVLLPTSVHNLFHGLYGKTRFTEDNLIALLIDIVKGKYAEYIDSKDRTYCKYNILYEKYNVYLGGA